MRYNRLGMSGMKVSELSLGGWTTFGHSIQDKHIAKDIIEAAYSAGINFFDIADVYARGESERLMGKILKDFPRHTLVISSKVFWPMSDDVNDRGLSRKHIMESIDKSLLRIGTDYLDIYYCHRYDPETPVLEVVRAMDDLVHSGKVLYWGTSEWPAEKIEEACQLAEKYHCIPPAVEQPEYHLLKRAKVEREIQPMTRSFGMGLTSFSPLAMGMLSGKYDRGIPEDSRFAREEWLKNIWYREDVVQTVLKFRELADALGVSRAQLAIAALLNQGILSSVITGATSVAQLEENLKAAEIEIPLEISKGIDALFPA